MITEKEINDLDTLLGHQDCIRVPAIAYDYAKAILNDKEGKCTLSLLVCSLYNYGYIEGQRAERTRRKRGTTA